MKLAHLGDTHIDERRRPEDTVKILTTFVEQARDADVDLIVHAGDFFQRKSSPLERGILADFLVAAAEVAPVFGVRGNHDAKGDLEIFNRLETDNRLEILGHHGVCSEVMSRFGCIALPWFDKSYLVSQLTRSNTQDSDELAIEASAILLAGTATIAEGLRERGFIPILVGHLTVGGAQLSAGQTLIGQGVEFAASALAATGAEYVALGHIHKRQGFRYAEARDCINADRVVWYSGSTERMNFGEPEAKGWNLVTFDGDGHLGSVEGVELPAREMVLLELHGDGDGPSSSVPEGSLVRVRVHTPAEHVHEIDEAVIRGAFPNAHSVKVELVITHDARVRSEAITRATSTWERVEAYLQAKDIVLETEQRNRIREKLASMESVEEGEVRHAVA